MTLKITWEGASYQSAKRAATADVRTPNGKTHRLYVRPTEPKARTFHGLIDGTVVGVWGGFELAKAGLEELFLASSRVESMPVLGQPQTYGFNPSYAPVDCVEAFEKLLGLVKRIQDALATGETGDGLVEVARNAARAERALAALETEAQGADDEDEAFRALTRRVAGARGDES